MFSGGDFYREDIERHSESTREAQGSTIQAGGNVTVDAGSLTVAGSDIHADNRIAITTDVGDVSVLTAEAHANSSHYERHIEASYGEAIKGLGDFEAHLDSFEEEDGRIKAKLAEATYEESDTRTQATSQRASQLTANNNISIQSAGDISVEGSHLLADQDANGQGDVNLLAGGDVSIDAAQSHTQTHSEHAEGRAVLSGVLQHQAVEVVNAVEALDDAKDKLKDTEEAYRRYRKDLKLIEGDLQAMEDAIAAGEPGVDYGDVLELRAVIDEAKGDKAWYLADIAAATTNVASATTALIQQSGATGKSLTSAAFGFNGGIQVDVEASRTQNQSRQSTAQGSHISGQNITIQTGGDNPEGTRTAIHGSHLQAEQTLAITTGELDIDASQSTESSQEQNDNAQLSWQLTLFGAEGGPSISGSSNSQRSRERSTTWENSTLTADTLQLTTTGNANLNGANVHANTHLDLNIGGNLTVESQQNRSTGNNQSSGISGGTNHEENGELSGVNAGFNRGRGRESSRETVLTSLTSGGTADIQVNNHIQVNGALIATIDEEGKDLGNLTLETETLAYNDLKNTTINDQRNTGISTSVGLTERANENPNQSEIDANINSSSLQHTNTSTYQTSRTMATLGEGNITVREDVETGNDSLATLNRDVENTERELINVDRQQGNIDMRVDHRLLTEDGWKLIKKDVDDTIEGVKEAQAFVENAFTELKVITTNLPKDLAHLGPLYENHLDDILRQGGDVDTFLTLSSDPEYQRFTQDILAIKDLIDTHGEAGFADSGSTTQFVPDLQGGSTPVDYVNSDKRIELMQHLTTAANYLAELPTEQAQLVLLSVNVATGGPLKTLTGLAVDVGVGETLQTYSNDLQNMIGNKTYGGGIDYSFITDPNQSQLTNAQAVYEHAVANYDQLSPKDQQTVRDLSVVLGENGILAEMQSTQAGVELAANIMLGTAGSAIIAGAAAGVKGKEAGKKQGESVDRADGNTNTDVTQNITNDSPNIINPSSIVNRSDFDRAFPENGFKPTDYHTSKELQDSAWQAYRDTSQGSKPIVMGRLDDTEAGESLGFQRLNTQAWSQEVNDAWVQGGIDARRPFYLGSNPEINNYRSSARFDDDGNFVNRGRHPETVFFKEMKQLRDAGYRREGDYMLPPPIK